MYSRVQTHGILARTSLVPFEIALMLMQRKYVYSTIFSASLPVRQVYWLLKKK